VRGEEIRPHAAWFAERESLLYSAVMWDGLNEVKPIKPFSHKAHIGFPPFPSAHALHPSLRLKKKYHFILKASSPFYLSPRPPPPCNTAWQQIAALRRSQSKHLAGGAKMPLSRRIHEIGVRSFRPNKYFLQAFEKSRAPDRGAPLSLFFGRPGHIA